MEPPPRILAERIVRRLVGAGHEAYLCGGCVRDHVMGREPGDYDIATSARPEEVQAIFPRTHPVGAQFGVVLVVEDGESFEVATFRTERGYSDGRRPDEVAFAGAAEDVSRRDFTMNGLLYDPIHDRMVDLVGGVGDIRARVVRTIGDPRARFAEDHLRLLRAVRFAAGLGFEIEGATWQALREGAPLVRRVAGERIRAELAKILTGPDPVRGMRLLADSSLLPHVLPEVGPATAGQEAWERSLLALGHLGRAPEPELPLATLLVSEAARLGASGVEAVSRRLAFSGRQIDRLVALVRRHAAFRDAPRSSLADLKRLLALEAVEEHLALLRAVLLAEGLPLDPWDLCRRRLEEYLSEPGRLRPPRLVTGDDLLAMGVPKGRRIGRILAALEEAQLEERVRSRDEALDLARRLAREGLEEGS